MRPTSISRDRIHPYLAGKPPELGAALEAASLLYEAAGASAAFEKRVLSAALLLIRSGTPAHQVDAALQGAHQAVEDRG